MVSLWVFWGDYQQIDIVYLCPPLEQGWGWDAIGWIQRSLSCGLTVQTLMPWLANHLQWKCLSKTSPKPKCLVSPISSTIKTTVDPEFYSNGWTINFESELWCNFVGLSISICLENITSFAGDSYVTIFGSLHHGFLKAWLLLSTSGFISHFSQLAGCLSSFASYPAPSLENGNEVPNLWCYTFYLLIIGGRGITFKFFKISVKIKI